MGLRVKSGLWRNTCYLAAWAALSPLLLPLLFPLLSAHFAVGAEVVGENVSSRCRAFAADVLT